MRIFLFALVCWLNVPLTLPAQDDGKLQERDRLWKRAQELHAAKMPRSALELVESVIAIEVAVLGKDHEALVSSYELKAALHRQLEEFGLARRALLDIRGLQNRVHGIQSWQVKDADLGLESLERWIKLEARQRKELDRATDLMTRASEQDKAEKFSDAAESAEQAFKVRSRILGELHRETADSLYWAGSYARSGGQYKSARNFFDQALAIRVKVLGEDHPETAQTLHDLGLLYGDLKERLLAKSAYDRALKIREKVLGDDVDTAWTLTNLGEMYREDAEYAKARPLLEKAVPMRQAVLGDEHADTAQALHNLALLYDVQQLPDLARTTYEKSLAIREKVLGDHVDTAWSLHNLGVLLREQGENDKARPVLEKALALRQKLLGAEHALTGDTWFQLGLLAAKNTDYVKAAACYQKAVAVREKALSPHDPATADALANLGFVLVNLEDFAKARECHERALAIRKKAYGPEHAQVAYSLNNLGDLLLNQGDKASARVYYEECLAIRKKILGEEDLETAATLADLANALMHLGQYAEAKTHYERVLAIRTKRVGENSLPVARSLQNLGTLLLRQNDNAGALPYLEKSLAIQKKELGKDHPALSTPLQSLGLIHLVTKQSGKALAYFGESVRLDRMHYGEDHPITARALVFQGVGLHAEGNETGARDCLARALTTKRRNLDESALALSERQQLLMSHDMRVYLDLFLSLGQQAEISPARAYEHVLAWKGAVMLQQRRMRLVREDPELARLAADLQAVSSRLANLFFASQGNRSSTDSQRLLEDLTRRKETLEIELAGKAAARGQAPSHLAHPLESLRNLLPEDTALVDFLVHGHLEPGFDPESVDANRERLTAFVIRKDQPIARVDLGPGLTISGKLEAWRELTLARRRLKPGEEDPGAELRRLLWLPLEKHLGNAKTILLSPDGALATLPFGALPGRDPDKYLIEEVALAVVPLPRLLPELLQDKPALPSANDTLLLVGDVDYGAAPGGAEMVASTRNAVRGASGAFQFGPLAGTKAEVLSLEGMFKNRFAAGRRTVLHGEQATEEALRREGPRHRWLHIATHGFFAPPEVEPAEQTRGKPGPGGLFFTEGVAGFNPGLLSGLALAGANRAPQPGKDDGIWTALEVAAVDLRGVELAVLSACETGLGKTAGGEGLLGLQRSFQVAGARTVVASLWSVPDEPTRVLMERFYENLWMKNRSKLDALVEAQRWMLREGKHHAGVQRGIVRVDGRPLPPETGRLRPYFWAAFVLSGDWR